MYSFHFYVYYSFAIVLIHYIFYLSSTIAIHQSTHQMIEHFNTTHEQPQRYRRFITLFDNKNYRKDYKSGDHSPLIVNDGEQPATATTKDLLEHLGHQTSRVLEGATDAVLTPFQWLSHITRYWPLYIVCAVIILGLITFLYCSCQSKIAHLFSHQSYDPMTLIHFFRQQQHPDSLPQLK